MTAFLVSSVISCFWGIFQVSPSHGKSCIGFAEKSRKSNKVIMHDFFGKLFLHEGINFNLREYHHWKI